MPRIAGSPGPVSEETHTMLKGGNGLLHLATGTIAEGGLGHNGSKGGLLG